MPEYKVGYFVGSLSSASINRILSKALIRVAPQDLNSPRSPSVAYPYTVQTSTVTIRRRRWR
jgi:hypothetical protein